MLVVVKLPWQLWFPRPAPSCGSPCSRPRPSRALSSFSMGSSSPRTPRIPWPSCAAPKRAAPKSSAWARSSRVTSFSRSRKGSFDCKEGIPSFACSSLERRLRPNLPKRSPRRGAGIRSGFVARARLEKEIPVILSETDLTPRVEDGEVRGLRVARLPDGTLLSESGLLPGDILVSINGEPLVGVDALWDLIARLVDQDEIRIVVRRRGEVLKLAYAFTH